MLLLPLFCVMSGCYNNPMEFGLGYESRGDYRSAIEAYKIAADQASNSADKAIAQGQLGRIYALLGEYREAVEILQDAKKSLPSEAFNYADVRYALGISYYELGRDEWDKSAEEFNCAIAASPKTLKVEEVVLRSHFYLWVIYWYQKKYALAQVNFQKALMRDVDSLGMFRWTMASAPMEKEIQKKTVTFLPFSNDTGDRSLDWLSNAIPENLIVKFADSESIVLVDSKHLEEILRQYGLSASDLADPDNVLKIGKLVVMKTIVYGSYQKRSANTLAIIGRVTDVETGTILRVVEEVGRQDHVDRLIRSVCDKLMSTVDPNIQYTQANIHFMRGNAYIFRGMHEESIQSFKEVLEIRQDWAQLRNNLANTYALASDYGLAIAEYLQALKLKPDWPEACYNLARVYSLSHDKANAEKWFEKAITLNQQYIGIALSDPAFGDAQFRSLMGSQ